MAEVSINGMEIKSAVGIVTKAAIFLPLGSHVILRDRCNPGIFLSLIKSQESLSTKVYKLPLLDDFAELLLPVADFLGIMVPSNAPPSDDTRYMEFVRVTQKLRMIISRFKLKIVAS